ncbi:MAG: GTPase [Desulfatiglandales bacterium]
MAKLPQRLQHDLSRISDLLNQGAFFSLSPEERRALTEAADDLSTRLRDLESEFLTIGLLGGTGVGKSTLMNALADTPIASASHRRPHTDHVLIYRHQDAPPIRHPSLKELPWREITHSGHTIRHILLCDLPDFDSLIGAHREQVLAFLDHLDVIVWVTSPEKYADGRFYEFLKGVPKAGQNYVFVLNKGDLLFQGVPGEEGYRRMSTVMDDYRNHIENNGIISPLVYFLSAEERIGARGGNSPWNQFLAFSQYIFQQRDIKQIKAIKAANMDVEVRHLLEDFRKEVFSLKQFHDVIADFLKQLRNEKARWDQAGKQIIALQTKKWVRPDLVFASPGTSPLIGPGYGLLMLFQAFQRGRQDNRGSLLHLSDSGLPDETAAAFKERLEKSEARLKHLILRQNLPASFQEPVLGVLNTSGRPDSLRESLSFAIAAFASGPSAPSLWVFKALQWLAYLTLFLFLLFAVGGDGWHGMFHDPGIGSVVSLLVTGIQNLFSGKGLAALGSYALLNLILAFRFFGRYRKKLRRSVERLSEEIKTALFGIWEKETSDLIEGFGKLEADIRKRITILSDLDAERER